MSKFKFEDDYFESICERIIPDEGVEVSLADQLLAIATDVRTRLYSVPSKLVNAATLEVCEWYAKNPDFFESLKAMQAEVELEVTRALVRGQVRPQKTHQPKFDPDQVHQFLAKKGLQEFEEDVLD